MSKKRVNNNLCLYYRGRDYKLDSYFKKKALVTSKDYSAQVAATTSEKLLER